MTSNFLSWRGHLWKGAGEINPLWWRFTKNDQTVARGQTTSSSSEEVSFTNPKNYLSQMKNTNSYHFNQRLIGLALLASIKKHKGYEYL